MEHQCGAMLIAGCPNEGYIEMTAEDLNGRLVHIITDIGPVDAVFRCGLPQGSGTACVRSNFIGRMEVLMWNLPLRPIPTPAPTHTPPQSHPQPIPTPEPIPS